MNGSRLIIDPRQADAQDVGQRAALAVRQAIPNGACICIVLTAGGATFSTAGLTHQQALHVMAEIVAQSLEPQNPIAPTEPPPPDGARA